MLYWSFLLSLFSIIILLLLLLFLSLLLLLSLQLLISLQYYLYHYNIFQFTFVMFVWSLSNIKRCNYDLSIVSIFSYINLNMQLLVDSFISWLFIYSCILFKYLFIYLFIYLFHQTIIDYFLFLHHLICYAFIYLITFSCFIYKLKILVQIRTRNE